MGVIIQGQPFEIEVNCGITLTGASDPKIMYRKPDETTGYIPAAISGQYLTGYMPAATNDQFGEWRFHASVIFSGDTAATMGEMVRIVVREPFYRY